MLIYGKCPLKDFAPASHCCPMPAEKNRRLKPMPMRSLLFVPADSPRKLAKAGGSGADVLLLDLEDSVALPAKEAARNLARDYLASAMRGAGGPRLYVRINSLGSGLADADLDAVLPARPDGILLPKSGSGRDVQHLSAKLAVREAESGLDDGATQIIAIASETAAAVFQLGTYAGCSQRLAGLTWGAEDLGTDVGALSSRRGDGTLTSPFQLARSLTLFGATAAGVAAIDTVFADFRNEAGLRAECEAARRDGFVGKMAIHPEQVAVINAAFMPTPEDLARAQAIVGLFADNPEAGVVALNGQMLDRPHLQRAQRVLGLG